MPEKRAFAMGRYQPYSHRHHEANVYMAEKIDADVLEIWIDDTHEERLPTSPMKGVKLRDAVERAYEDFYRTDFRVEVRSRDAFDPGIYPDLIQRAFQGYSFVTGEISHARKMQGLKPFFTWFGYDVSCWPEQEEIFGNSDFHIMGPATTVREDMRRGDGRTREWRKTVPDPVENCIDRNYEEIARALRTESDYYGAKYRDIIASNGGFLRTLTDIHDMVT